MSEESDVVDEQTSPSAPASVEIEQDPASPSRYSEEAIPVRSAREREAARVREEIARPIAATAWRRPSLPSFHPPHLAMRARSVITLAGLAAGALILAAVALRGEGAQAPSPTKVASRAPRPAPLARVPLAPKWAQRRGARAEPQRRHRKLGHRRSAGDRLHRKRRVSAPAPTAVAESASPPPSPVAESPAPEPMPAPPPVSTSSPTPPPQAQQSQLEQQFGFER